MATTLLTFLPGASDISSGTNNAQFGIRNGHRVLDFDDTTAEEAKWTDVLPEAYTKAGFDIVITWLAKTATTGDVVFSAAIERHNSSLDYDSDNFATAKTVTSTTAGTSGLPQTASISFTYAEAASLDPGQEFRVKVIALTSDGSYTLAGDAQITSVQFEQASGSGSPYFAQGTGGIGSVVGQGASGPVASQLNSVAQGDSCIAAGIQAFAWGKNVEILHPNSFGHGLDVSINDATNGSHSFAQGSTVDVVGNYHFAQGNNVVVGGPSSNFAQGATVEVNNTQTGGYNMAQGNTVKVYGTRTFAQGKAVTVECEKSSFAQGDTITLNEFSTGAGTFDGLMKGIFAQGEALTLDYMPYTTTGKSLGYGMFLQGKNITINKGGLSNTYWSSMAQGFNITLYSQFTFAQGKGHVVGSSGFNPKDCLVQGFNCKSYANTSFTQGRGCITGTAGSTPVNDAFAQGYFTYATKENTFAQGYAAHAIRTNQKTWGSNIGGGIAQSSVIVQGLNTVNATPTAMITLDLAADTAYFIDVSLVVRNTTADTDDAIGYLATPILARRNASGGAVLITDPQALTLVKAGASALASRLYTSGNNIILEVTGTAVAQFNWLAELKFVERKG